MVSTRGLKYKFSEGEKVLCYEPDPTKAKVLYDSKVLDVIVNKDQRGRKAIEYLIHFQGWNSSWDRCVSEDYVLKDTDENRQLQRDLAEKAQLQFGAYLYRRERKKRTRKLSDKNSENADSEKTLRRRSAPLTDIVSSSEEYNNRERVREMIDSEEEDDRLSVSSGDASSGEGDDDKLPFQISEALKRVLEKDCELITKRNKIFILPAEPTVVNILEAYVKHYVISQICGYTDKSQRRYRAHGQNNKIKDLDKINRNVNLFKEIVDGIRIYFDFTLGELLLYNQEKSQYKNLNFNNDHLIKSEPSLIFESCIKNERDDSDNSSYYFESESSINHNMEEILDTDDNLRKKSLRSHRSYGPNDIINENISSCSKKSHTSPKQDLHSNRHNYSSNMLVSFPTTPTSPRSNALLRQVLSWKIIPDSIYNQSPPPPSLIYGATHLLRLFVKLPDLLCATNMPDKKLKFIFKNLDLFLNYLEDHVEWFGEDYYRENNVLKTY